MTAPRPAPAGLRWAVLPADGAHPAAYALVAADGLRLVIARDGETWTVYDASGTILRDGVRPDRLPAVLIAVLFPALKE